METETYLTFLFSIRLSCTGFSGCHRYEAHQRLGLPTIRCKVRRGTKETLRFWFTLFNLQALVTRNDSLLKLVFILQASSSLSRIMSSLKRINNALISLLKVRHIYSQPISCLFRVCNLYINVSNTFSVIFYSDDRQQYTVFISP